MIAEQINQTISMRMVADKYNLDVNRAGFTVCPFHREETPSLKIYDEAGKGFYCFGCHAGGDVIKFVMKLFGLTFPQALVRLASDFGLSGYSDPQEVREWQRRQRAVAREKKIAERESYIQFLKEVLIANRLRLEVLENSNTIQKFLPTRDGWEVNYPMEWINAIRARDKLNFEWEEAMGFAGV